MNKYEKSINYKVRKFEDVCNVIIPHFTSFPLLTQKRADLELFKQGVLYIKDKESLSRYENRASQQKISFFFKNVYR